MRFLLGALGACVIGCGGVASIDADAGDAGDAGDAARTPTVCAPMALEAPATACGGASSCPVEVAARATCSGGFGLGVAAGADARSFVLFTTNSNTFRARLWTVGPGATSDLESDMVATQNLRLLTDATGNPTLLGAGAHGAPGSLQYFTGSKGAWNGETITSTYAHHFAGTISSDGTVSVIWGGDTPVHFAKRTGPGAWTDTTLTGELEGDFAIAVDSTSRAHMAYWQHRQDKSARDLLYSIDAGSPTAIAALPYGFFGGENVQIALASGDVPLVAIDEPDGTHVVAPQAQPAVDAKVAETGPIKPTGCPDALGGGNQCYDATCTETATGSLARSMVAASDGTVWLAYVRRTVDRDVSLTRRSSPAGNFCDRKVSVDRSATELVMGQMDPSGSFTVRWRAPLGNFDDVQLALASRGARLHVALATKVPDAPSGSESVVRLMVVDRTKL